MDGVLVDTAKYHFKSWEKIADKLGFHLNEKVEEQLKGISRMDSLEIVLKEGNISCTKEEKVALAKQKNDWYLDSLKNLDDSVVLSGVIPFLNSLKEEKIPLAVGSASKNATLILERLGMTSYFISIVDGNLVIKTKPDPEVFMNAARDIQLKETDCVVFEDSQKGIIAAKTGKFKVIGIGNPSVLRMADAVIPSFNGYDFSSIISLLD